MLALMWANVYKIYYNDNNNIGSSLINTVGTPARIGISVPLVYGRRRLNWGGPYSMMRQQDFTVGVAR